MLSKEEIEERARYCYCVFLQLSWLYSNDMIEPSGYLKALSQSSLGLGTDDFVTITIEEALMENRPDGGLLSLISLYEGFAHAFCQVLERELNDITIDLSPVFLRRLGEEVGVQAKA